MGVIDRAAATLVACKNTVIGWVLSMEVFVFLLTTKHVILGVIDRAAVFLFVLRMKLKNVHRYNRAAHCFLLHGKTQLVMSATYRAVAIFVAYKNKNDLWLGVIELVIFLSREKKKKKKLPQRARHRSSHPAAAAPTSPLCHLFCLYEGSRSSARKALCPARAFRPQDPPRTVL